MVERDVVVKWAGRYNTEFANSPSVSTYVFLCILIKLLAIDFTYFNILTESHYSF